MLSKAQIKRIRSLVYKKYREKYRQYLIEGERLVTAALEAKAPIQGVYLTAEFQTQAAHVKLIQLFEKNGVPYEILDQPTMNKIAPTITPPGILGICDLPHPPFPELKEPFNWLYLDRIQDPGNLGTLLRTADWFGLQHIALSAGCADPYNPKVVRGGMGAHFHLAVYSDIPLRSFTSTHTIIGAHHKGQALNNASLPAAPWVLVLGNEAQGITPSNRSHCQQLIAIPRKGGGESLNVAVAGGILLHRLTQQ
jgi:TrmH family RNA methyltransferase